MRFKATTVGTKMVIHLNFKPCYPNQNYFSKVFTKHSGHYRICIRRNNRIFNDIMSTCCCDAFQMFMITPKWKTFFGWTLSKCTGCFESRFHFGMPESGPFTHLCQYSFTLKCDFKIHGPFQIIRYSVPWSFPSPDNVFCGNKVLNTCSVRTQ